MDDARVADLLGQYGGWAAFGIAVGVPVLRRLIEAIIARIESGTEINRAVAKKASMEAISETEIPRPRRPLRPPRSTGGAGGEA